MNNYIFKYNIKGDLYNYCELDNKNKILSIYNLENNKLIRYDKDYDTRHYVKYSKSKEVVLAQRFQHGESWVTVMIKPDIVIEIEKNDDNCAEYSNPEYYHWLKKEEKTDFIFPPDIDKQYIFEGNRLNKFKIKTDFIGKWKEIVSDVSEKKSNRIYPHITISLKK